MYLFGSEIETVSLYIPPREGFTTDHFKEIELFAMSGEIHLCSPSERHMLLDIPPGEDLACDYFKE